MLFRSTIFAAIAACVVAKKAPSPQDAMIPDFNIPTDSKTGKRLLSKARRVEQNNNNNNNNEQEADWLAGYSIKYDSCASLIQVREEGGEEEGLLYTQNLVKFVVCAGATSGCSDCGSGIAQYVVNMNEFVQAYSEMKKEAQEAACETVREYCYCDNANDDEVCENQCYADAGMSECIQYEGQEEVEIDELLECGVMEGGNGNNNNNNGNGNYNYGQQQQSYNGVDMYRQYYIGPMCSPKDGKSIFLAAFYDAGCTSYAGTGVYEAFNYGYPLPYETEPIVALNDCISCLQVDNDNNNNNNNQNNNNNNNQNNNNNYNGNYNQNQNMEAAEICQQSYEMAAKCESNLGSYLGQYYYTDTSGCDYIHNILPSLQRATRKIASGSSSSASVSSPAATAFAVIFGLTTALLGAYSFFLYRKIHRAKVNLAQAEMGIA